MAFTCCVIDSTVQSVFAITPLNWQEWQAVLLLSAPVLVLDEVLKFISVRNYNMFFLNMRTNMRCPDDLFDTVSRVGTKSVCML